MADLIFLGKQGAKIKELEEESGAKIKVSVCSGAKIEVRVCSNAC